MKSLVLIISACTLSGCATRLPDSVHWFRDSAEQKAVYVETYRAATRAARELSSTLAPQSWGVILDVDETILDNSDYEKRLALSGKSYKPETWNAWVDARSATLLPGAKAFIDTVQDELHGKVILVTNRTQDQCAATEDNLHAQGIRYEHILCDRAGDGDKNPRFHNVIKGDGTSAGLNVLIWVGDNIQDFPSLSQSSNAALSEFGTRYFVLPNPLYGSWSAVPAR